MTSALEGVAAEIVGACSGSAILTGWALHLRTGPSVLAVILALPQLGQCVQVPAAWLTSRFGSRRVAIVAVGLSRQSYLLLALMPLLPERSRSRETLLVASAALATLLGVVGNNGWTAWMGELVPAPIRGRYFARRTALCTAASAVGSLLAGALVDTARTSGDERSAFLALAVTASGAGAVSTVFMLRQRGSSRPAQSRKSVLAAALAPWRDGPARSLLTFQVGWNAAVGLAASFFTVFMLQNLRMSFVQVATYGAVTAICRISAAGLWGRAIDRVGARPVLVVCSVGIALLPLLWLFATPDTLWPVVADAVSSGILWGGHAQALFLLPLAVAPREGRPYYLAAFSSAAGVAFSVATAGGAWLVAHGPPLIGGEGWAGSNYQLVFALSAVARLACASLALGVAEPREGSVRDLWEVMAPGGFPQLRAATSAITGVLWRARL